MKYSPCKLNQVRDRQTKHCRRKKSVKQSRSKSGSRKISKSMKNYLKMLRSRVQRSRMQQRPRMQRVRSKSSSWCRVKSDERECGSDPACNWTRVGCVSRRGAVSGKRSYEGPFNKAANYQEPKNTEWFDKMEMSETRKKSMDGASRRRNSRRVSRRSRRVSRRVSRRSRRVSRRSRRVSRRSRRVSRRVSRRSRRVSRRVSRKLRRVSRRVSRKLRRSLKSKKCSRKNNKDQVFSVKSKRCRNPKSVGRRRRPGRPSA